MSRITDYLKGFFKSVESTDCALKPEETVNGQAFEYELFSCNTVVVHAGDRLDATLTPRHGPQFKTSKVLLHEQQINTVAIFRCKEAFGMTDCVGVAFGLKRAAT